MIKADGKPIVENRGDLMEYAELLTKALPSIVETEEENERLLEIINNLVSKDELSPDERKLLRLLVKLVEDFEEKTYLPPKDTDPLGTMLFLMEQHGLKQTDMVGVFGSDGRVSDVVNGKRGISKNHAKKLSEKFNVSVALFI